MSTAFNYILITFEYIFNMYNFTCTVTTSILIAQIFLTKGSIMLLGTEWEEMLSLPYRSRRSPRHSLRPCWQARQGEPPTAACGQWEPGAAASPAGLHSYSAICSFLD